MIVWLALLHSDLQRNMRSISTRHIQVVWILLHLKVLPNGIILILKFYLFCSLICSLETWYTAVFYRHFQECKQIWLVSFQADHGLNGWMAHPSLDNYLQGMFLKWVAHRQGSSISFKIWPRLLEPSCDILQAIGSQIPYECAIGVNGFVYLKIADYQ